MPGAPGGAARPCAARGWHRGGKPRQDRVGCPPNRCTTSRSHPCHAKPGLRSCDGAASSLQGTDEPMPVEDQLLRVAGLEVAPAATQIHPDLYPALHGFPNGWRSAPRSSSGLLGSRFLIHEKPHVISAAAGGKSIRWPGRSLRPQRPAMPKRRRDAPHHLQAGTDWVTIKPGVAVHSRQSSRAMLPPRSRAPRQSDSEDKLGPATRLLTAPGRGFPTAPRRVPRGPPLNPRPRRRRRRCRCPAAG